jgi:site-specific recombinase XerD
MDFDVTFLTIKRTGYIDVYLSLISEGGKFYVEKVAKVAPGQWEPSAKMIIKHNNARKFNMLLDNAKHKLNNILLDYELQGKEPTVEEIKHRYAGGSMSGNFIQYAREKLKQERGIKSDKTLDLNFQSIEKLRVYKPDFSFDDLTYENLRKFEAFLTTYSKNNSKRGHDVNARYQVFSCIRKINRIAKAEGKTTKYPFDHFRLKTKKVKREFLSEQETDILFNLWDTLDSLKLKKTLAYYLFSCETGVSADDHYNDQFTTTDSHIYFHRKKTNEPISIRLSARAKMLLPFLKEHQLKLSRWKIKQDLTEILNLVEIDKEITFHTARHTFAVTALKRGVSIKAVQAILGHTSVKTTETYAQIANEFVDSEMEKFDRPIAVLKKSS